MVKEHREPGCIRKPVTPDTIPGLKRENTGTIMDIRPVYLPVYILTGVSSQDPL
jgi:hypothetical protein